MIPFVNELRIGNWVDSEYDGNTEVYIRLLERIAEEVEVCNPIPLTPEILEKCGFIKDYFGLKLEITEGISIRQHSESDSFFGLKEFDVTLNNQEGFPVLWIQYLHTLQNLYFALTGEELEIEL